MYLQFFGLSEPPFRLMPDRRFLFESRGHTKALSYLQYGLHKSEGFVVVTGEVGTGKTMLADTLIEQLADQRSVSLVAMTQLDPEDLVRAIGLGFGLDLSTKDRAGALDSLSRGVAELAEGGRTALVLLDEAQNLPIASLEELRMLSNLRNGSGALLQVFLIGQPGLRAQLARPELDQLMQRVVAMCHLQPLSAAETGAYVGHRLERAGWCGDPDIEEGALALVYKEARGLPRRINMLMDRLLLLACLEQRHRIDRALAEEMILDLREEGLGPAAAVREVDR